MICIKCQSHEAVRGEFCKECFEELRSPEEPDFEIPDLDDVKEMW